MPDVRVTIALSLLLVAAAMVKIEGQSLRDLAAWEVGLVAEAAADECSCAPTRAVVPMVLSNRQ